MAVGVLLTCANHRQVAGAGVILTWDPGELAMWAASAQAVTYDCCLKVAK